MRLIPILCDIQLVITAHSLPNQALPTASWPIHHMYATHRGYHVISVHHSHFYYTGEGSLLRQSFEIGTYYMHIVQGTVPYLASTLDSAKPLYPAFAVFSTIS